MATNKVNDLSLEQERAIIALLKEPTVSKAADETGIGERTTYNWLDMPTFSRAYRKARREAFAHAIALTQKYAPHAVQTLVKVMADPDAAAAVKVSAAVAILKFGREGIELDDLAGRVEALEQAASQQQQPRLAV
jgi:hypothetical protein